MMFVCALLLAVWFHQELVRFPTKINRQVYQDYQTLCATQLNFSDFQAMSNLQQRSSRLEHSFYLLFPLISVYFSEKSLAIVLILIVLCYLAVLDFLYYLTDVNYIALIFLFAINQLLFSENLAIQAHLITLFSTSLFFLLFSGLLHILSPKTLLGSGDILLIIALSPLFLLEEILKVLLCASLSGIFYHLLYRILLGKKLEKLPFIPFITLGFIVMNG